MRLSRTPLALCCCVLAIAVLLSSLQREALALGSPGLVASILGAPSTSSVHPAPALTIAREGRADSLVSGGGAIVIADSLNLRAGPGVRNPVVGVLLSGTVLRLLDGPVSGAWWRVTDGVRAGYVSAAWLSPAEPPDENAFDLDLPVPFHRQETAVWCEAADLQSWTEYVRGEAFASSYRVQSEIWDWELSHNAGFTEEEWNASPYAVASAAHQWMPDRGFNHFIYNDPVQATKTMAWLLANPEYREPSIALIWRGDHYVLVRGVRATADPFLSYPDAEILGVYILDPNQGSVRWQGEDRYVPMSEWLGGFLTPVSHFTPHTGVPDDIWQRNYVTIQRGWTDQGPTLEGWVKAGPEAYIEKW